MLDDNESARWAVASRVGGKHARVAERRRRRTQASNKRALVINVRAVCTTCRTGMTRASIPAVPPLPPCCPQGKAHNKGEAAKRGQSGAGVEEAEEERPSRTPKCQADGGQASRKLCKQAGRPADHPSHRAPERSNAMLLTLPPPRSNGAGHRQAKHPSSTLAH